MAVIKVEFNTETKEYSALVDGATVEDLSYFSMYKRYNYDDKIEFGCELCTETVDKESKVSHRTSLTSIANTAPATIKGLFYKDQLSKAQRDIMERYKNG